MPIPITVRFPPDLQARVRDAAQNSDRSLSAEIVHRLRRSFAATPPGAGPRDAARDENASPEARP